jgi:hypothetical protein
MTETPVLITGAGPTGSPTTIAPDGDRVPGEFLGFWQRVDGRVVRRARDACQRLLRFDPIADDAHVRAFAHGYYDADPVAEAFVDEVYLSRGANEGRRMLDQAIAHGVDSVTDAPDSMRRLFDEFERPPEWLDRDLVERGAALFRRYGPAVFSFAGVETLLGYTESSIVKPLAFTGTYAGDTAHLTGSWRRPGSGSMSPSPAGSSPPVRAAQPRCACGSCTSSSAGGCSLTPTGTSRRGECRSASPTR